MGLYMINCTACGKSFMWFSGVKGQQCESCQTAASSKAELNIDNEIAEKVFGWVKLELALVVEQGLVGKPKTSSIIKGDSRLLSPEDWDKLQKDPLRQRQLYNTVFRSPSYYSTDIAAAWTIVEKLTKDSEEKGGGPPVEITHDGKWHCRIGTIVTAADTAPMAICLAALELYE